MVLTEERYGAAPVLGAATLQDFRNSLHGQLVLPQDAEYDEVRKVFNAMIDRRPALIVRCIDTHDVVQSVQFARSHNLPVAMRGGGHSVAGHSMIEGLTCTPESDPAIMRVLRSTKGDFHAQEPLQRRTDCWHAPRA